MLRLKCPKHPYYTAKNPPRASCQQCIELRELKYRALAARLQVEPNERDTETTS